jgi:hypothetical protein
MFILVSSFLLVFVTAVHAQTLLTGKNVEVRFQNYLLRGAVLRDYGVYQSEFLRGGVALNDAAAPSDAYLAAYSARFYGLERYERSSPEIALEGMGMGASMGLFVGALGNTLGLWDEDKTWLLVGAMSALGAAWASTKADDPKWRYRFRWEELEPMTVPTE